MHVGGIVEDPDVFASRDATFPWIALTGRASVAQTLIWGLQLSAVAELGAVTWPVVVLDTDDAPLIAMEGMWLGAFATLMYAWETP